MEQILHYATTTRDIYLRMIELAEENATARKLHLHSPSSLMLMLWPALWGLASRGAFSISTFGPLVLLALTLRISASLYDDLMDSNIERAHEGDDTPTARTPSLILLTFTSVASLFLAFHLGASTLSMVIIWLFMVIAYPHMFKVTWWPQVYAGFLFGAWPVLIGQTASGHLGATVAPMMIAGFFWGAAIETLRADMKRTLDLKSGLKSAALALSPTGRISFIGCCMASSLFFWVLSGMALGAGGLYYAFLMLAQALITHTAFRRDLDDVSVATQAYHLNAVAGLTIVLGLLIAL